MNKICHTWFIVRVQKSACLEGLEYYTLATSNKDYEGYTNEVRSPPREEYPLGKIITPADPVLSGYKLNYIMDDGRNMRSEV